MQAARFRRVSRPGAGRGESRACRRRSDPSAQCHALKCRWSVADGHLRPLRSRTWTSSSPVSTLRQSECFQLLLADGQTLKASDLKIVRGPEIDDLAAGPQGPASRSKSGGKRGSCDPAPPDDNLAVQWRVELRDGSNYVRQYVSLAPKKTDVDVREIVLVRVPEGKTRRHAGRLPGHPRGHVLLRLRAPAVQDSRRSAPRFNAACHEARR